MNAEQTRKLQLAQLELMDEIHRICTEYNIRYYMIGGTALGAVRHKGFIPWDVDIDIAMPRADYDRFKEICKKALNSRYIYRDFTNTKDLFHGHALVCIKNTRLVIKQEQYNPKPELCEIYVDVLPLDNAPADKKTQQKQAKRLLSLKKARYYKMAQSYDNNVIKAAVKRLVSKLMFWTSVDKINKKFDAVMRKYNYQDSGYICSMASHYTYEKLCMPTEVFGTPKLVGFEGRQYFAPEQTEEYLTRIFGDYMKLPPENERQEYMDIFTEIHYDLPEQSQ